MISSSVTDNDWLSQIESTKDILIVAEGLTMYLKEEVLFVNAIKIGNFAVLNLIYFLSVRKIHNAKKYSLTYCEG